MGAKRKKGVGFWLSRVLIGFLLVTTFYPFLQLLNMSFKSNLKIKLDFLGFPSPVKLENYVNAWGFVLSPILNSLFVCAVSLFLILFMVFFDGVRLWTNGFQGKEYPVCPFCWRY